MCCLSTENRLTYSITSGNVGNAFEVAPDVGEIKVRGHLDYEDGPRVCSNVIPLCNLYDTFTCCIMRCRSGAAVRCWTCDQ